MGCLLSQQDELMHWLTDPDLPNSFPSFIRAHTSSSPWTGPRACHVALRLMRALPDMGWLLDPAMAAGLAMRRMRSRHRIASGSRVSPEAETVASHSRTQRCREPSLGGSLRVYISNRRMRASVKR